MFFSQTDPRWSNYIYSAVKPHNETLYSSGCGICSACNIVSNLTDTFILPPAMADYAVKKGYRMDGIGTSWGLYESIAKKYGLELHQTTSLNKAIECVKNGGMVICSTNGSKGLFSNGGHLFTMVFIDGDIIKFFDSLVYIGKYATSYRKNKATYKDDFVYVNKKYVAGEIQQYFCFKRKEDEEMAEKIYHFTEELPEWSKRTVQKLLDKGFLQGANNSDLNLPETMLRILVINDRAGLYDLKY